MARKTFLDSIRPKQRKAIGVSPPICRCSVCGKDPTRGAVFRSAEEGEWRCRQHFSGEIAPEVEELVSLIEKTFSSKK
jgi:hypothetical protein